MARWGGSNTPTPGGVHPQPYWVLAGGPATPTHPPPLPPPSPPPPPPHRLFQDRRKELGKKVAKMGEDGKVAVRNVRKDILKKLDRWGKVWASEGGGLRV